MGMNGRQPLLLVLATGPAALLVPNPEKEGAANSATQFWQKVSMT